MIKRLRPAIGIACCLVLVLGCGAHWKRTPLVDSNYCSVSLEEWTGEDAPYTGPFDHPADIEPALLYRFLGGLRYKDKPLVFGKTETPPVFQEKELLRLAPVLSDALSEADPSQRLRFISYNRGGGLFLPKRRRTGGVIFLNEPGRIDVAFGYINHEILDPEQKRADTLELYKNPLKMEETDTPVLTPAEAGHRLARGKKMPMWITAELDRLETKSAGTPADAETAAQTPLPEEPAHEKPGVDKHSPDHVPVEHEPRVKKEQSRAAPTETSAPAEINNPADGEKPWKERKQIIGQKLEYLKSLHEDGLISTEEYGAEKRKLLENLN